jgi:hypothetical protein
MATFKRVDGDYTIVTINIDDNVIIDTNTVSITGNLDVSGNINGIGNIFGPQGTWRGGKEKAPAAICRKVIEAGDGGTIEIWGDGKQRP